MANNLMRDLLGFKEAKEPKNVKIVKALFGSRSACYKLYQQMVEDGMSDEKAAERSGLNAWNDIVAAMTESED